MKEVYEFLKEAGTFYLATFDEAFPRVRPFGVVSDFENKLYIQTGKKKEVYKQIKYNNHFEISATKGDEWIRINGLLIEDDQVEAKKYMLDLNPVLRSMYDENDDNTVVFYIKEGEATIYSFTKPSKKYRL